MSLTRTPTTGTAETARGRPATERLRALLLFCSLRLRLAFLLVRAFVSIRRKRLVPGGAVVEVEWGRSGRRVSGRCVWLT